MPTDLNERLANYRCGLDDAIASDLASRPANSDHRQPHRRRVFAVASAMVIVAAGIGALAWANTDRSTSPSDTGPIEHPQITIIDSAVPVEPEPTTAPASVVPAPSETSPPGAVIDRLAIGDSVMLGAATELVDFGFVVDAVESRTFVDGLETIQTVNTQTWLGDVVVVHLGSNGPIDDSDMTQMMDALAEVPQVLLVTIDMPRDWTMGNNRLIYDAATTYPNVSLVDWAEVSGSCPGNCFYEDGFHLRPDGKAYYADLINAAIEDN